MPDKTTQLHTNAAIFYHPDGYMTGRDKLMGRHAAGEGFLRGLARHLNADTLYAYAESRKHFDQFCEQIKSYSTGKSAVWLPQTQSERLAEAGTLYLPGPGLSEYVWQRRCQDPTAYSVTGVTHTICTDRVMDSLGDLLIAPVEEWDAVIFTSREVKKAAENMLTAYGDYLSERLGTPAVRPRMQMPVIPLGVDCEHLTGDLQQRPLVRKQIRERHGIKEDDIVVLFLGRLSYHAKAHPLPMYQALETASRQTGSKLHIILAGWFANEGLKKDFMDAAKVVCPSVQIVNVDGRQQAVRDHIWHAADIFCSLSDNIQETFGLTPIEAMAAGLPVVVSDWDGYRDTVENGVTGFMIPTAIPAAGCGEDLAMRYFTGADTYDQYIGYVSQSIAVDVEATTAAFIELIKNPDLRRRMGEAGQSRARRLYDWRVVIAEYEALWKELADRRPAGGEMGQSGNNRHGIPLRADPFSVYPHYASQVIDDDTRISITMANPFNAFHTLTALHMNNFGKQNFADNEAVKQLLRRIRKSNQIRVGELLAELSVEKRAIMQRTIGWLAKMGIVKILTE